jgi:hypothetical protein
MLDESAFLGTGADLPAGESEIVTWNLEPGSYELVCFMAGHYAAGQTLPLEVKQSGLFPSLSVSLGAAPFGARFRPRPRASLRHVDHSGTILNRVANHLTRAGLRSPVHDLLCASTAVLT